MNATSEVTTRDIKSGFRWRGFLVAAMISVFFGILLTPTDDGPKIYGRVYLPLFAFAWIAALFAKRKNNKIIFNTALSFIVLLPFLTVLVLIAIY